MNDNEILSKLNKYQGDIKKYTILYFGLGLTVPFIFMKAIFEFIVKGNWILFLIVAIILYFSLKPIQKKLDGTKHDKSVFIGENIIRTAISQVIDIHQYAPTNHIDRNIVKESPILPEFDKISGWDYICGTYNNVKLQYSDIRLKKWDTYIDGTGKKRSRYEINFRGSFLRLNLNSQIDGYVKLIEKNDFNRKGLLDNMVATAKNAIGLGENSIKVENATFNEQFDIFTDNEELAYYILTPHFMESIVAADKYADGATNIYFNKNYVDIAIDSRKNSFEIKGNIKNQEDLDKARMRVENDLKRVLAIVDQILTKDRLF